MSHGSFQRLKREQSEGVVGGVDEKGRKKGKKKKQKKHNQHFSGSDKVRVQVWDEGS